MGYLCLAGLFCVGDMEFWGFPVSCHLFPASALVLFIYLLSFPFSVVSSLSYFVFALRSIPGCFSSSLRFAYGLLVLAGL